MMRIGLISIALAILLLFATRGTMAADKVVLQLGWVAEPDFGGLIEAKQAGIYASYGLDVDLRFGNAQTNPAQLLLSGNADFICGPNSYALNALRQGYPLVVVAAIFQKSLNVLISHKGVGNDSISAMRGKPIMIAFSDMVTFWPFLKQRLGFEDSQLRPYNANSGPFLHDLNAIQQGYATEEPFVLRKAGADINVFPLADAGYDIYGATIITRPQLIARNPDVVRRFVAASIAGWKRYMAGDGKAANDLIKQENPQMTDDEVAFAIQTMKSDGLLDSGDARTGGIGAMSDDHWRRMFEQMASLGLYPKKMDYHPAYTLQFVGRPAAQSSAR